MDKDEDMAADVEGDVEMKWRKERKTRESREHWLAAKMTMSNAMGGKGTPVK